MKADELMVGDIVEFATKLYIVLGISHSIDRDTANDMWTIKLTDKNVAVIGSGLTGLETAEYLNEQGNRTTILEMAPEICPGAWMQHIDDMLPRLQAAGTVIRTDEKLCEVYKDHIVSQNTKTSKKTEMPVDAVVLALGSKADLTLYNELKKTNWRVFGIGDTKQFGNLANATKTAYEAAVGLK